MAKTQMHLEVATPKGLLLKVDADAVDAPGVQGDFGVLPDHLPMLSSLRVGVLSYRVGSKTEKVAIGTGFIEVGADKVTVLTDRFATPSQVDAEKVQAELSEARKSLAASKEGYGTAAYAELALREAWSESRLALLKK